MVARNSSGEVDFSAHKRGAEKRMALIDKLPPAVRRAIYYGLGPFDWSRLALCSEVYGEATLLNMVHAMGERRRDHALATTGVMPLITREK